MDPLQHPGRNMNEKDIMKVIAEAQVHEQQAYEAFCAKFDVQFPMPEKAAVKLMNAIGWQSISICVHPASLSSWQPYVQLSRSLKLPRVPAELSNGRKRLQQSARLN